MQAFKYIGDAQEIVSREQCRKDFRPLGYALFFHALLMYLTL